MTGQYVVILTGGARPGDERADPPGYQLDLAIEGAGTHADPAVLARRIAEEGWQIGYVEAAKRQRVRAVWVVDAEGDAARFAEFVTREIDPAYVARSLSPLAEMLTAAEALRGREQAVADGAS